MCTVDSLWCFPGEQSPGFMAVIPHSHFRASGHLFPLFPSPISSSPVTDPQPLLPRSSLPSLGPLFVGRLCLSVVVRPFSWDSPPLACLKTFFPSSLIPGFLWPPCVPITTTPDPNQPSLAWLDQVTSNGALLSLMVWSALISKPHSSNQVPSLGTRNNNKPFCSCIGLEKFG